MQVAVVKGQNAVDLSGNATGSVFNSDGSFVAGALAALATITVANRIRSVRRWSLSNLISNLFRPRYRWDPPRHVTRAPVRREPERIVVPAVRTPAMPRRQEPRLRGNVSRSVEMSRQRRGGGQGGRPGGGQGGRR